MARVRYAGGRGTFFALLGGLCSGLPISVAFAQTVGLPELPIADQRSRPEVLELPTVDVIGTTLLPGMGTAIRDVPSNVQVITQDDLARQRQNNLTEYLEQNPSGVTINAAQGNPYQPDVSFRGFAASPLLGVPQGLSVFQDGVRINEPFGDVVNWDLIPQSAISSIQLIPGSNPAFGLNTLGGALAIYTKSGSENPGGVLELSGGAFGRRAVQFEQGGKSGPWDYFVTGNAMRDRGWAEHNASRVAQFFGKGGYQTKVTDLDLSLTLADNTLEGTQTLPQSFSDNIRQAYTYPDQNKNKLTFMTLKGSHFLNDSLLLGGTLYYRKYRNDSFASNVNAGSGIVDPDTGLIDAPEAINNQSSIDQTSYGLGLQLTSLAPLGEKKNQVVVGMSADLGRAHFTQASQPARFTADRGTEATGPFTPDTDAGSRNQYYGLFATDTLSLTDQLTLTVAGRYNVARVQIEDRSGTAPQLAGDHTFSRFNPAVGLNFNPTPQLTAYASYNEGMRAPTPIELTCADPTAPCKLPNNFLSDPPLKKVVSKTVEVGVRGKSDAFKWRAAIFRTSLQDDIAFISSLGAGSNSGYFQNVGASRRQGIELSATKRFGALSMTAHYSYLDATYQSSFLENSPVNSGADATGAIAVRPGNRIAGLAHHNFKLRLDYAIGEKGTIGANLMVSGPSTARGDENNADVRGQVPGYAVVNLDGSYQITNGIELFGRINNVSDRSYANFGILGRNVFANPERRFDPANAVGEQFRGYGTPRGMFIGVRYRWL